jgi:hypothetical protein
VLFPPPACTLTDVVGVLSLLLCANVMFAMAIVIVIAVDRNNIITILACFLFMNKFVLYRICNMLFKKNVSGEYKLYKREWMQRLGSQIQDVHVLSYAPNHI